ncbi:MAG: hypothetical protein V4726_19980 [Verrucomicrobiota bacterium]
MTMPLSSRFRATATMLALSLLPLAARADDLATVLPESAIIFGEMRSIPKLLESKDHPLAKKLNSGELGKVFEKLMGDEPEDAKYSEIFREETGLTEEEVIAKLTGGLAAGMSVPLDKLIAGEMDEVEPGGLLVADFSGDEALFKKILTAIHKIKEAGAEAAKTKKKEAAKASPSADEEDEDETEDEDDKPQAKWPEQYEEIVTEVDGSSVHEWTLKDEEKTTGNKFSWAIADGRLILGLGDADTKEAVRRQMKKSSEGSLASTTVYKEIDDAAGEWDVLGGMNLERGLGAVQEAMRLQMEKGELNTGLPVNPLQAWAGAGVDQFRGAFMAWDLQGDAVDFHASLTYAQKPALLKLYAATGPGEPPLFAPLDAQEVSWGTMDWGKMFDNLKELAVSVSPMAAGGIEMGLNTVKTKIGVDLRKDILGQMGDNLWSLSKATPPEKGAKVEKEEDDENPLSSLGLENQSQLLGIALRDAKAFELSLKSIFNTAAPGQALFEDRDYLGNTIHEIKGLPPAVRISWLIKSDTLILSIGKPELLEKALAGMDKKPATPLLEQDFVKSAFAKLPEGQNSAAYYDAGMLLDAVVEGMKSTLENIGPGNEFGKAISDLPDHLDLPLFIVTRTYLSDKSADLRLRLAVKP